MPWMCSLKFKENIMNIRGKSFNVVKCRFCEGLKEVMNINHPKELDTISLHTTHSSLLNYSGPFIMESFSFPLVRKGYIYKV